MSNRTYVETFEKRPLLPNSCVPDGRDLRFASTGSNFNPQNALCIPVVKIFAFLGLEPRLNIKSGFNWAGKIERFSKVSC